MNINSASGSYNPPVSGQKRSLTDDDSASSSPSKKRRTGSLSGSSFDESMGVDPFHVSGQKRERGDDCSALSSSKRRRTDSLSGSSFDDSMEADPLHEMWSRQPELLDSLKDKPDRLIELFKSASKDKAWLETNQSFFLSIIAQVIEFERGGECNTDQLNKISSICKKVSAVVNNDKKIQENILEAHQHALTMEHALDFLVSEEPNLSNPLYEQCMQFISQRTGQTMTLSENKTLEFIITHSNDETDKIIAEFSRLDEGKRGKFNVHIKPLENISEESLEGLAKAYGQFANALTLNEDIKSQDHFEKLIQNFSNLNQFSIKNNKITSLALLEKLPLLQTLTCSDCRKLTALPENLPLLQALDCSWCSKLTALPSNLPLLQTLTCLGCCKLTALPNDLPLLQTLDCSYCWKLTALPNDLPQLQALTCSHCSNLTALPNNLPQLQALICSHCVGLTLVSNEFSLLQTLTCSECFKLTTLPKNLPLLQTLNCSSCWNLKALPNNLPLLQTLACSSCNNLTALPEKLPLLQTLTFSNCHELTIEAKLRFLVPIYEKEPIRGFEFAKAMNVSETELVHSLFTLKNPSQAGAIIDLLNKIKLNKIRSLLNDDKIPFVKEGFLREDPLQQLFIYILCSKFPLGTAYETLSPLFKLFVKTPMDDALLSFYQKLIDVDQLFFVPPMIQALFEIESERRFLMLPYFMLAKSNSDTILKNLQNLEKSGLIDTFLANCPFKKELRSILGNSELFTGEIHPDREMFNKLEFYMFLKNKEVEELLKLEDDEQGSFLRSNFGKILLEEKAKDFLKNAPLQRLVVKLYPPRDPENLKFYPITINIHNNNLYLTILSTMPLDYPDAMLNALGDLQTIRNIDVKHYASPGIDDGGLKKQFISQLIQGVLTRSENIAFEKLENGKMSPRTKGRENVSAEDRESYTKLGSVMGMALKLKLPTGEIFSDGLVACIHHFSSDDLERNDFSGEEYLKSKNNDELVKVIKEFTDMENTLLSLYEKILTSGNNDEIIEAAQQLYNKTCDTELLEALSEKNTDKILGIARENLYTGYREYFEAAHPIAQGIKLSLPFKVGKIKINNWEDLQLLKIESFSFALQGRVTAEWIKNNLEFSPEDSEEAKNLQTWVNRWIDDHKDEPEVLANWVATLTGARALASRINFMILNNVDGIVPHTCANTVDVPKNMTEELLRIIMDAYGTGEDLAFTEF